VSHSVQRPWVGIRPFPNLGRRSRSARVPGPTVSPLCQCFSRPQVPRAVRKAVPSRVQSICPGGQNASFPGWTGRARPTAKQHDRNARGPRTIRELAECARWVLPGTTPGPGLRQRPPGSISPLEEPARPPARNIHVVSRILRNAASPFSALLSWAWNLGGGL